MTCGGERLTSGGGGTWAAGSCLAATQEREAGGTQRTAEPRGGEAEPAEPLDPAAPAAYGEPVLPHCPSMQPELGSWACDLLPCMIQSPLPI